MLSATGVALEMLPVEATRPTLSARASWKAKLAELAPAGMTMTLPLSACVQALSLKNAPCPPPERVTLIAAEATTGFPLASTWVTENPDWQTPDCTCEGPDSEITRPGGLETPSTPRTALSQPLTRSARRALDIAIPKNTDFEHTFFIVPSLSSRLYTHVSKFCVFNLIVLTITYMTQAGEGMR